MDTILPQLLSFPPHPPPAFPSSDADVDKGLRGILKILNEIPAKKLTAGLTGGGGGDLLDILDPSINTLPYLYVLVAHINSTQNGKQVAGSRDSALLPGGRLWKPMLHFMESFDTIQIRYGGNEFKRLIHAIENAANQADLPAVAIHPLQLAITRLDPSGACFTLTHLSYVQLCLETRQLSMARPVLDRDIYTFPLTPKAGTNNAITSYLCASNHPSSDFLASGFTEKVTARDILQYFLIGGIIYTALGDYERAIHFYELAIVAPATNAVSKIQLEAYSKRLLVGLIWKGVRLDMPKSTSSIAAKTYRATTKAYDALAEIFEDSIRKETGPERLYEEAQAGHSIWDDESNIGLVRRVCSAFERFTILRLSKTYLSLPIAEVLKRTYLDSADPGIAARQLQTLISGGQLNATLSQRGASPENWILRFEEESRTNTEAQQLRELKDTEARLLDLSARITESDQKIGISKEYLDWSRKEDFKLPPLNTNPWAEDSTQDEEMMVDI